MLEMGLNLNILQLFFLVYNILGPAHEILVAIAYAQKPSLNTDEDAWSWARGLHFVLSLDLHSYLSRDMCFPTMWHFNKFRLRRACAASF